MTRIAVGDISMYCEEHGDPSAAPLLLVAGLSLNTTTWYRQVPALAERFRVVAFDNRGAGRSDRPVGDYTIPLFADDTARLMDALGIESAHVCGMSMGGMIAQELALRHAGRVRSLALLCTSVGGPDAEPADVSMQSPQARDMTPAEAFERAMGWLYSDAWALANRDELLRRSIENAHLRISPEEFARQRAAINLHDTSGRLSQIGVPVLVLAGVDDPLIPISNPRRLHRAFPGARMVEYPGRHYFHIEFADDVNRELLEFFSAIPEHAAGTIGRD